MPGCTITISIGRTPASPQSVRFQRHAAAFDTKVFVQRFREFVNSEIERHAVRLL